MQIIDANPTLIVAAIAGIVTLFVGWKRPFVVLAALVILIPFRDLMTRWLSSHSELSMQQVTAIGRWWSGVVVALLIIAGSKWIVKRVKSQTPLRPDLINIMLALIVLIAIGAAVSSPSRAAGLISMRGYLQSIPVFLLARLIVPSRREIRTFLPLLLAVGFVIGALSIFQAVMWDEATYLAEGYVRPNGELVAPASYGRGEEYLRPPSTVSGPNELGVDMVVMITIVLFWLLASTFFGSGLLIGLAILFAASLAASASRSGALGFVAAVATTLALRWKEIRIFLRDLSFRMIAGIVVLAVLAIAIAAFALSSTGLLEPFGQTIRTLPGQYHYIDTIEAIEFLVEHPQGAGMGLVRPKPAVDALELENTYHAEGSLFQIAIEMGIWGLFAWGIFFALALLRIVRGRRELTAKELLILSAAAAASWAAALVAFAILPLMQSISLMIWLWFLLGIGINAPEIQRSWSKAETRR